ncbi:hypothetical protein ANO11243_039020 [Dothideomycetidae sp. 11243]|nr:hypothetical protein ANO11243_039020 [fungal sp. No.11243]
MQCFSELIPPTAVTQAISLPFLGPQATDLVVAKTSLLQIFSTTGNSGRQQYDRAHSRGGELKLVGEYSLSGTVTSLARIRALGTKTGGEALLVSFKDAKVSLLEWDPENYRISTVSIHYYEGGKVQLPPFEPPLGDSPSKVVVDPRSRCAALRFASRHLAIIPFRQPDDDVVAVDDDFLEEIAPRTKRAEGADGNVSVAGVDRKATPYTASFVLAMTALDPSLTHPVDLAFLHEYREPTFGIVSANRNAATALLDERKDPLSYTVIALDLEQRASTTLLSVKGLPFDIWKIIPLPRPIGGSLLVGTNELIHVDQSGKTIAVAVNEYAKQCSDFSMADQSQLNLRLENCCIETLNPDTGDLLVILRSGDLAILSFKIDGRTVSGLHLHPVDNSHGGELPSPLPSASASIGANRLFMGSQIGDAKLLSWASQNKQTSRKRSHAQMLIADEDLDIDEAELEGADDDAEDDLYGDQTLTKSTMNRVNKTVAPEEYDFYEIDSLPNLGPVKSLAVGKVPSTLQVNSIRLNHLEMFLSHGESKTSKLAKLSREIALSVSKTRDESNVTAIHSLSIKDGKSPERHYIITSELSGDGKYISSLLNADEVATDDEKSLPWIEVRETEFETEGRTLGVFYLHDSQRTIQVRDSDLRCYDKDLSLSQIFPIIDASTDEELQVIHASFCDPYLLLLRSDSSVQLLKADATGELDEVEGSELQKEAKWLSACLYQPADSQLEPMCFLLNERGGLVIVDLANFGKAEWSAPNLAALPAVLTTEDRQRRAASREPLVEILFANLGPTTHPSPFLILRSSLDEIIMYEPFHHATLKSRNGTSFYDGLNFRKVSGLHIAKFSEDQNFNEPMFLKAFPNIDGKAMVFVPGDSPSLIIKTASTAPQIYDLRSKPISVMTHIPGQDGSSQLAFVDSAKTFQQAHIPQNLSFGLPRCVLQTLQPLPDTHEIHEIAYHAAKEVYAIVSSEVVDFILPDEDIPPSELDQEISLRPQSKQYFIHLLSPITTSIISTYPIPSYEHVSGISCAPMELNELTHIQEYLVIVGTICQRADPYADKGAVYAFSVLEVVPEPDRPETAVQLHLISREETRAGITAITAIAGLSGTAQGQKLMFRGLRDDGQNLPVAFLDIQTYTTSLKTLGDSNLWLAADYWKGIWFGGYSYEPPRITVFAKSTPRMALVEAEFLPHDTTLCLVGADDRGGLQVWQFDPEHPKSLGGTRLIHRSSFQIGHLVTGMKVLPSAVAAIDQSGADGETNKNGSAPLYQVLTTASSGQIGLITPLDEGQYRRLSALQNQLTNVLEHPAGLNPKAYRNVKSEDGGGRGVVDGDLLRRIGELGAGRRSEIVGRVVGEGGWWEIRSDLEVLGGRGLDFF